MLQIINKNAVKASYTTAEYVMERSSNEIPATLIIPHQLFQLKRRKTMNMEKKLTPLLVHWLGLT